MVAGALGITGDTGVNGKGYADIGDVPLTPLSCP